MDNNDKIDEMESVLQSIQANAFVVSDEDADRIKSLRLED